MTVLEYAKLNGVTASAVYQKIKRGRLQTVLDADGCVSVPEGTPWVRGRPGIKPKNVPVVVVAEDTLSL